MVKTITFAMCHFSVAFTVAYFLTGDAAISSVLAMVEPACNTVAYYFHEKGWERWKRRSIPAAGEGQGDFSPAH